MTRRKASRIRRKANAWARKARRSVLRRGESKRRICTAAEFRRQALAWLWLGGRERRA